MADSRNILTRLLESEASSSMPYILRTAGALLGGSFLYYYWMKRLKSEPISAEESKNPSENPNEDNQESKNDVAMEFNGPVQSVVGVNHGGIHHHHHNNPHFPREAETKESLSKFFQPDIPFFVEDRFVKRNALLSQIESTFLADQEAPQQRCRMTALTACHGLGGVGKTQLALYYYYKSEKAYSFRYWFSAERLDADYRVFCERFKLKVDEKKASFEEISRKVKQWLEENPGWLLVYDNATDANITKYLPRTGGDILLTSRQTRWNQIGKEVQVNVVTEKEAIELVKRAISIDEKPVLLNEQEEMSLKELAKELGYLPLALAQAAAYIKNCPGMTITSYLDKYKKTPDIYLDKPLDENLYPKSVAKTWLITMEEIEKRQPAALPVFKACAYLAPDAIPIQLLSQLTLELNPHSAEPEAKEGGKEDAKLENNPLLDEILICLSGFSMMGYNKETGHVSVHRLVQTAIRQNDEESFSMEECFKQRLKPLSAGLLKIYVFESESHRSLEYYSMARVLQLHFKAVIAFLEPLQSGESRLILLARLCDSLGNILSIVVGDAVKAVNYYQRSLKMMEATYGKDHVEVAKILNNLANAYSLLGDHEEERLLLERALKIMETYYGENHLEIAKMLNNLGNTYGSLSNYTEKRDYLKRALKIMEAYYGKHHVEIAKTLNNLGNAYGSLGDYSKERVFLTRALEIQEKHYGKDHIEIAKTLNNLGNTYGFLDDHINQCNFLKRALIIKEAHYGENHIEVAITLNNLGKAYVSLKKYEEARDLLERTLKIKEMYYEKDHIKMVNTLNNLGNLYKLLGNNVKARDFLEHASKIDKAQTIRSVDFSVPLSTQVQSSYYYNGAVSTICAMVGSATIQPESFYFCAPYIPDMQTGKSLLRYLRNASVTNDTASHLRRTVELVEQPAKKEERQRTIGGFFDKEKSFLESLIKKYKLLDDNQPSLEKGLRNATANGNFEDLVLFARYVKNLDAQDENPKSLKTAAHWAAVKGHADCYNFLVVEKKVRTDIPDASNKTASEYRVANQKIAVT